MSGINKHHKIWQHDQHYTIILNKYFYDKIFFSFSRLFRPSFNLNFKLYLNLLPQMESTFAGIFQSESYNLNEPMKVPETDILLKSSGCRFLVYTRDGFVQLKFEKLQFAKLFNICRFENLGHFHRPIRFHIIYCEVYSLINQQHHS